MARAKKPLNELPVVGVDATRRRAKDQSIRVPGSGTAAGAGFGDTITDNDREWAAQREPVAHRIVYTVAADIFDNWFEVDDPRTEGKDAEINAKVQAVLDGLNAKTIYTDATAYERNFGWSLIVLGCDDAKTVADLRGERRESAQIQQLEVYKKTDVAVADKDNDPDSERFGQPVVYRISRGSGNQVDVHYSRTIRISTRLGEFSVLDPIWDDLTCLRNIRWGMAQTMYRYGSGFPVLQIPGATKEQLKAWSEDPEMKDLMARTYLLLGDGTFDFKGTAGRALDPANYYKPIFENIAVGSGIPEAILRGAQAGAIAGSEVNEREYFKVISSLQSKYEPFVWQLIDILVESGQIEFGGEDYQIVWKPGFEPSEMTRNQAMLAEAQARQIMLQYMTVDEVRALASLEPLPNAEGEVVPGLTKAQPSPFGGFGGDIRHDAAHPTMKKMLADIVGRAKKKEIDKAQAVKEASEIINQYAELEEKRALVWVRNRLGKPDIREISSEHKARLMGMRQEYLGDFVKILDDSLRGEFVAASAGTS